MRSNYNKKKFILFPSLKKIKYIIITLLLLIFLFFIYDEFNTKKRYQKLVQEFSEKYNYQC